MPASFPCRAMLALLTSALLCGPAGADETPVPSDPESFHLIVLAGQSNMAGRGRVTDQDRKPHARVLMLNKQRQWAPAADPLHFDKPQAGVGLGRTFAIDYAEAHPDVVVGLVPCAVGGSPIATWEPGGYHGSTKTHPWDDAIERINEAQKSGTLKAILWHQGESDSKAPLASAYEKKLHALIARFRKELDSATLPFVAGQMGYWPERPWDAAKKQVDAAYQALPEKVPHTAFVSSAGLKHKGDQVHFDSDSLRAFGHRYFKAYQKLTAPD